MLTGSIVALVTPMQADGSIDKKALHNLVAWHLDTKTDGIVVIGTTGEAPTLTDDEQLEVIQLVVKQVAGRIPVIAGTGTNCTASGIQATLRAKSAGVDACLMVAPYYNKPTQKGVYEHFKLIAEKTNIPIILYNQPGRTGHDILPESVERLATIPEIKGIKEVSGKVERVADIAQRCGKDFAIYSGDDDLAADMIFQGAHGVISVTANIAPREMHDLCVAALARNKTLSDEINQRLTPLYDTMFLETNPIPIKWALHEMDKIGSGIRLPLLPLDTQYHDRVRAALQTTHLLQPAKIV